MNNNPNPAMPVANQDSDPVRLKIEAMFDLLRCPAEATADLSADRTDETSEAWQRFRIVRSHAKGGLVEIRVAFDEQLNRDVALKKGQVWRKPLVFDVFRGQVWGQVWEPKGKYEKWAEKSQSHLLPITRFRRAPPCEP
jgi:hypothetical protein